MPAKRLAPRPGGPARNSPDRQIGDNENTRVHAEAQRAGTIRRGSTQLDCTFRSSGPSPEDLRTLVPGPHGTGLFPFGPPGLIKHISSANAAIIWRRP